MDTLEHIVVRTEAGWKVARFLTRTDLVRVFSLDDEHAHATVQAAERAAKDAEDRWIAAVEKTQFAGGAPAFIHPVSSCPGSLAQPPPGN